ncbi:hypothetical protein KFE98_19805 [bacterium SCSIO 12741]|nr:hypothetical protein KFE98_19805 [bacterium SCSIO 12741]
MNRILYSAIILLGLLLVGNAVEAQVDRLPIPRDSTEFFNRIEKMMNSDKTRKQDAKDFLEQFEPVWFGGYFDEEIRTKIYETCDRMNERRLLPFPDFYAYLSSVSAFVTSGHDMEQFYSWHQGVDYLIEGKSKRKFENFLLFSSELFKNNTLYKTNASEWRSSTSEFKIQWEGGKTGEAVVDIPECNLVCYAKNDSAHIFATEGKYYPMQSIWVGHGGTVNWNRAGFEEEAVVAKIKNYRIEMDRSQYHADSAEFKNTIYFGNAKLLGELEDKVLANVNEDRAQYPRFKSYKDNLKIRNIFPNVDYQGGFTQKGTSFIGSGTDENPAKITINRNGKPFLEAYAKSFIMRSNKINADPAEIFIYFEGDTIYHPGTNFKFDNEKRTLVLFRNNVGRAKSPYYNEYHGVDMHVEVMEWNIDGNMMHMKPLIGNTNRGALFESTDFYKAFRFDELYGLGRKHPLVILKKCSETYQSRELLVSDVAQCWGLPASQVKPMMMILSNVGFVRYDYDEDKITVMDKTFNYVLARVKKVDYDIIQFNSEPKRSNNADFNLDSLYMQLHGVRGLNLSDSHNVLVIPTNGEILLKHNRDFDFSGVVVAGRLEIFGRDFSFKYDSFLIRMPHIDSMRINVELEEMDTYGRHKMKRVRTVIEQINGVLEIDKPSNKSGKIPIKRWPVFRSFDRSYAYYDKGEVLGGVYDRNRFMFELEPFVFDSLDNFQNSAIQFDGTFKSGGVFEDFTQTLSLQNDYSLGFVNKTPDEGMPIYEGRGTFYNDIHLSHEGLKGDGYLDYITSTTESQSFFFFPDSANGIAQNYVIEEQYPGPPEYPPVEGHDLNWHWYPAEDTMTVANISDPIGMYDGSSKFSGTLIYNPDSLIGTGKGGKKGHFEFDKAITESDEIRFRFYEFLSDTADFALKTGSLGELGFDTKNMRAHVSFKDRVGHFWANGEASEIVFTKNEYKAKMDEFTWHMDDDMVDLTAKKQQVESGASGSVDIEGAKLTCIKKHDKAAQDSLFFYSSSCKYDLKRDIITADEVKYVEVADAEIIPDSNRLVIYKEAKIRKLANAQIVANKINRFHKIYNAELEIINKIEYKGSGKYDYKDINKSVQVIDFQEIYVSSQVQTVANGKIGEEMDFTLSPKFRFRGEVALQASKELLEFAGGTQINHECKELERPWIKFVASIDPEDVMIPVDTNSESESGDAIFMGQMMGSLPANVYSLFGAASQKPSDKVLSSASGVIAYNYQSKEFRVGSEQKVNIPTLTGNYLTLSTEKCVVQFEGEHDFGAKLGRIAARPVGKIKHDLKTDSVTLETSLLVNFFFEEKALKDMSKEFQDDPDLERVDYDNTTYNYGIKTLIGEKEGEKIRSEVALTGKMKRVPDELAKTFYFTNLKLYWNPQKMAFLSSGGIGYGNSLKQQVNKISDGTIMIKKKRSGDIFAIYLKIDKQTWYYFSYSNEVLETVSTNDKYNTAIKEAKKNKQERTKGQARFRFIPTPKTKVSAFLRQI